MGNDDYTFDIKDLELSLTDLESSTDTVTISLNDTYSDSVYVTDTGSEYTFNVHNNVEFEDTMPSAYRINEMCKHYPALDKAWTNFKTIYKMVDQDYRGNFEDDIPF